MRKLWFLAVLLCAGLTTASVGAAADKQADLIEKAKKEGSIVSYTTSNSADQEAIHKAFNQKYPFIKIDGVKLQMENWTERVAAERAARRYICDIGWGHIFAIAKNIKEGFLAPYNSPERGVLPNYYKDKEGLWSAYAVSYLTAGYNTDLVKQAEAPKTWDDLTNPKWKGKTVGDDYNIELLSAMIDVWGKEKAVAFWKKIAANNAVMVQGRSNQTKLLAAGEYSLGIGLHAHEIITQRKSGAPVTWINSLNPMPALIQAIGLYKDAPHPNAAKLFIDWLLSPDGQKVFTARGRIPSRPGSATAAVLASGVQIVPVDTVMAAKEKDLGKLYWDTMGIKRVGR